MILPTMILPEKKPPLTLPRYAGAA
jgi:hypothetical protein